MAGWSRVGAWLGWWRRWRRRPLCTLHVVGAVRDRPSHKLTRPSHPVNSESLLAAPGGLVEMCDGPVRALGLGAKWKWPCGHVCHGWQSELPVRANWHGWLCHGASGRSWRRQCVRCGGGQCRYPTMPTTSTTKEDTPTMNRTHRPACHGHGQSGLGVCVVPIFT